MRFAYWVTKATDTHPEYIILTAVSRQQWLRERATMLLLYVHYVFCLIQDLLGGGLWGENTKFVSKYHVSVTTSPLIVIDQRQQENLEYFNNLGSMIINDERLTREIKSRNDMAESAFNKNMNLLTNKLDSRLRKKLVKSYICSVAFYGAESWTFLHVDQKYFRSFEMWCWRRMEETSWTDRFRNQEILRRIKEESTARTFMDIVPKIYRRFWCYSRVCSACNCKKQDLNE
jgi:hypothetical protein